MALFKTKKETEKSKSTVDDVAKKISVKEKKSVSIKKTDENKTSDTGANLFSVLKYSRITEKATDLSQNNNAHVFEVDKNTNKTQIAKTIKSFYNVVPKKIRIVRIPPKNVISRGKKGVKSGGKKAYVYLKKEDKIENI